MLLFDLRDVIDIESKPVLFKQLNGSLWTICQNGLYEVTGRLNAG
jgi:hypothetical protein